MIDNKKNTQTLKSILKVGMTVTTRYGTKYKIIKYTDDDEMYLVRFGSYLRLSDYNDNLIMTKKWLGEFSSDGYDIQEIHDVSEPSSFMDFNATNTNNVIWTR